MADKKYEFTGEVKKIYYIEGDEDSSEVILHRIRALRDFGEVRKGDLGGWIEKAENLPDESDAWIADEAKVYGDACVFDGACVFDRAEVSGKAKVRWEAKVYGNARVGEEAEIFEKAELYGKAIVCGKVKISGEKTKIYDSAKIYDYAIVYESKVYGNVKVNDHAHLVKAKVEGEGDYITTILTVKEGGKPFTAYRSIKTGDIGYVLKEGLCDSRVGILRDLIAVCEAKADTYAVGQLCKIQHYFSSRT